MTIKAVRTLCAFLWPVRPEEYSRFIPMFLISFLISFNYYLLRIAKDAVLITAPKSGAEAIPFIKVWGILPMAFLMTFIFTRLSNVLSRKAVFYTMIWIYIAYFLLFTFILYPNQDLLHPHNFADRLEMILPKGFHGLIAIIRNWTFATFYVMSEMWSTMILTILFWGFANDVVSVNDAKRFYGLFALGTSSAGIFAGLFAKNLSKHIFNPSFPFGTTAWDQSVALMNLSIILIALVAMGLFWWLNKKGLGYPEDSQCRRSHQTVKMGIRENFSYLSKSKYLSLIAILVITYNVVINLAEVVWKHQIKQLYPNPADFNAYMGGINFWISMIAVIISLFIAGNLIRILGWTKTALIAPILTLITGIAFFSVLLLPTHTVLGFCLAIGSSPLVVAGFLGSLQNCLIRGTKYGLVDSSKELTFIPLNLESRLKGKTAIDGVGSRLGKSGSSLMYQFLLIIFGSITNSIPFVAILLLISVSIWIFCVRAVGKRFQELTQQTPGANSVIPPSDKKNSMLKILTP